MLYLDTCTARRNAILEGRFNMKRSPPDIHVGFYGEGELEGEGEAGNGMVAGGETEKDAFDRNYQHMTMEALEAIFNFARAKQKLSELISDRDNFGKVCIYTDIQASVDEGMEGIDGLARRGGGGSFRGSLQHDVMLRLEFPIIMTRETKH